MSEHQADLLTVMAVAFCMPLVGIGKLFFSQVMRRNTVIRTPIGDWLVKMFIAVGLTFLMFGGLYGLTLAVSYQWITPPLWIRWPLRIGVVVTGLMSLTSTAMCVRNLLPLLRSIDDQPQYVSKHPSGLMRDTNS
jgi:hypothetical protein